MMIREVIPKKKNAYFWTLSKNEGGSNQNPKVLGVVFLGLSFGHFPKRGGGLNPFLKFWGSFEVFFLVFLFFLR